MPFSHHKKLLSIMHNRITIHFSTCLFTNNESMIIKDGRFISVIQSGNGHYNLHDSCSTNNIRWYLIEYDISLLISLRNYHWFQITLIIPSQSFPHYPIHWSDLWTGDSVTITMIWLYSAKIRCRTGVGTMAFPPRLVISTGIHESCERWQTWVTG